MANIVDLDKWKLGCAKGVCTSCKLHPKCSGIHHYSLPAWTVEERAALAERVCRERSTTATFVGTRELMRRGARKVLEMLQNFGGSHWPAQWRQVDIDSLVTRAIPDHAPEFRVGQRVVMPNGHMGTVACVDIECNDMTVHHSTGMHSGPIRNSIWRPATDEEIAEADAAAEEQERDEILAACRELGLTDAHEISPGVFSGRDIRSSDGRFICNYAQGGRRGIDVVIDHARAKAKAGTRAV